MTLGQQLLRQSSLRSRWILQQGRTFSTPATTQLEQSASENKTENVDPKLMTQRYHKQRTLYKKQVSALRKQYAEEVAAQKALKEAREAKERMEIQKRRKERQRLKNLRSIENAKRDIAEKAQRAKEFALELEETQKRRDARNELFRKARMLLLQELEEESVHWMTTPEEVEEKLGNLENEQRLWGAPHLIGAAPEESIFWKFQSHFLPVPRSLLSPREYMLEKMEEKLVMKANQDDEYWTPKRRMETTQKLEKAKLRALVEVHGRSLLLKRQNRMLRDEYLRDSPDMSAKKYERGAIRPQKKIPAPSLAVLANYKLQEEEGVKSMMEDPSRFFVFEQSIKDTKKTGENDNDDDNEVVRGRPISLKHEEAYPLLLAKDVKADNRTEKEKRRAQKEDERLAKLHEAEEREKGALDFEHDSRPMPEVTLDDDDLEWEEEMLKKGFTKEQLNSIPMEERLTDEDVEWLNEKLHDKLKAAGMDRYSYITENEIKLNEEEVQFIEKANTISLKLTDGQLESLTDLDLTSLFEAEELDKEHIMKEIESYIGSDVLSKDDLGTLIEIEQRLMQDQELREKLSKK